MKQVLLAINGETPSRKAFQYAVDLSRRLRAELSILRFIDKDRLVAYFKKTRKKAFRLGRFLENSFAGIAFAEEGLPMDTGQVLAGVSDPLNDFLKNNSDDIPLKITVSHGDPEKDLGCFVDSHHDVVLTILDSPKRETESLKKKEARIKELKKKLGIPVVVINASSD